MYRAYTKIINTKLCMHVNNIILLLTADSIDEAPVVLLWLQDGASSTICANDSIDEVPVVLLWLLDGTSSTICANHGNEHTQCISVANNNTIPFLTQDLDTNSSALASGAATTSMSPSLGLFLPDFFSFLLRLFLRNCVKFK